MNNPTANAASLSVPMGEVIIPFVAILLLLLLFWLKSRRAGRHIDADPITQGLNIAGLEAQARKYLGDKECQYAVVNMELANYLQLLQTFGSHDTHRVLKYLQHMLKSNLSRNEPIAHAEGGSFCFLLKNRQQEAIRARLARISEAINQFNYSQPIPYRLELRFGVCTPSGADISLVEIRGRISQLMESSTEELCFCKENAGHSLSRNWEQIQIMEKSLKNGDFVVYLQPKVRLRDDRVVGAEALIRWKHPEQGLLTPEMFVPLLEEYHLISNYDLYIFEQVCKLQSTWIAEGKAACPISFNLSHDTAKHKDFLEPYIRLTKKYGIAPELIEFELSRKLQQQDIGELVEIVKNIHDCGFRCALDRFGSRSINLQLLRELNVDTVKLDYSFFSAENNKRRNRFVLEAVIKAVSQMQIKTVAEGIDNESQVLYLKQVGCDLVQGFYYFPPLSVDEFSTAVFSGKELPYLDKGESSPVQNTPPTVPNTSANIVMFSMLTESDRIVFSSLFSPVLEGCLSVDNAISMLSHSELIHENDRKDFFHLLERCLSESGWVENAIRFYTARGRYEWLEVHLHKEYIPAAGEMVISGTLINMAGWENELDRWKDKAHRDVLTGLFNREYFEQFASSAMQKDQSMSYAVIFMDIDDFKNVNDTLGHTVGDDVICWFAKRILGSFRHTDVVARYGGDEFVVFANGIERAELSYRLQQLCESFRSPYRNGNIEYTVSGSIGAAMFPDDGRSYLELLDRADSALYEAKRLGKNRFVLYHSGLQHENMK